MEIRRVPMSIEEYHRLPFHPGWKVELLDGIALFQPREALAFGTLAVAPSRNSPSLALRQPARDDEPELVHAFRRAFVDSVEYCGWPAPAFEAECHKVIGGFLAGKRGPVSPASRLAISGPGGEDDGAIIGAALVLEHDAHAAMLDVLLVAPPWQRRGVATALAEAVLTALAAGGKRCLISSWHLGSEASIAWHRKLGFREEPDWMNARLYRRAAEQELRRLEELGQLDGEHRAMLTAEKARWDREAERLQELMDRGDIEGASAVHRFRPRH